MVKQVIEERRKGVRAKRILSIQYRLSRGKGRPKGREWHLSTTQDMSIMGLSFLAEKPHSIGDVLELKVVMSGVLDIFDGEAQIVRIDRKSTAAYYFVGVRFLAPKNKPKKRKAKTYSKSSKNRIKSISKK